MPMYHWECETEGCEGWSLTWRSVDNRNEPPEEKCRECGECRWKRIECHSNRVIKSMSWGSKGNW